MIQSTLQNFSNEQLNTTLKELRSREREIVSEVIFCLHEIDARGYFRDLGYSSLFTYCVSGLGYSESAAQRRIQAARALGGTPEIYTMLREGRLTLSAIGEIAQVITAENKEEILTKSEGKSKAQVQSIAAQFQAPVAAKPRAVVRAKRVVVPSDTSPSLFDQTPVAPVDTVESRYTVSLEVDSEFIALYEKAKALIGHRPMAEVLRKALTDLVEKRTPQEAKVVVKRAQATKPLVRSSRYIPRSVRAEVYRRDKAQCTFIAPDGHRCTETVGLQYDHILPYALGGQSTAENLRLTCRAHNQLFGERVFGARVSSYRHGGSVRG